MTVEHLNYTRQFLLSLQARRAAIQNAEQHVIDRYKFAEAMAITATKFMLPPGGRLLEDPELRALDYDMTLNLPFEKIALEVPYDAQSKSIIFAHQQDTHLICVSCRNVVTLGWCAIGVVMIPRQNFKSSVDDEIGLALAWPRSDSIEDEVKPYASADAWTLIHFLNALACSNVRIDRSPPKKAGKKIKSALPFDTYHVLTIDAPGKGGEGTATGGQRLPREHLRRGHIRRLADSRRIWVNATVVASGRGAGVVTKDYALRC